MHNDLHWGNVLVKDHGEKKRIEKDERKDLEKHADRELRKIREGILEN